MKIKGNDYNFGRVIYLTLIKDMSNARVQDTQFFSKEELEKKENITICFDPSRATQEGQLNTRLDFYVKHMGDAGVGNNGFYTIANIDVYNIGPALKQFLDAYNAYKSDGHFKDVNTKKYAVVLQVGYRGQQRTTIFAGHISSFVMERQQTNTSVDNIWHFFCQYPDAQQNSTLDNNKAVSGEDYGNADYWNSKNSVVSWETFLKNAIMARKRTVYVNKPINNLVSIETFSVQLLSAQEDAPMSVMPKQEEITELNFNNYFKIEYRAARHSPLIEKTKKYWQYKAAVSGWNIDVSSLQKTVENIARAANCHARVELDENTGIQTIYIYPANKKSRKEGLVKKADYIIVDYQNLRNAPQVSANMLHLDMLMEPSMRPGDTIELQITQDFLKAHPHPTFQPNFSMSNTSTVFAGANFIGLANMNKDEKKKNAIAATGNIFNTKFIATIVEFIGSSHTAEWATKVNCYGVEQDGKETTI